MFFFSLFAVWILFLVIPFFHKAISSLLMPHGELYHNSTEIATLDSVVRPLIDENQAFDIAVSVWIRATEEEEEIHRKNIDTTSNDAPEGDSLSGTNASQRLGDFDNTSFPMDDRQLQKEHTIETPLFSDVVFRGLHLNDKAVFKKVQFRMPTARLCVHSYMIPLSRPSPNNVFL